MKGTMRSPIPFLFAAALLTGLLAAPVHALDRTLVVRGRAQDREGAPLAGARITARGSVTLTATTDAQGRYVLRTVVGSPASLARAPFTLEVRAEYDGRRLPFVIQGSAFALDVALVQGGAPRVRVRSNAPSASLAVAAAFVSTGAPEASVEVDFGGASATGAPRLSAVEEVAVPDAPPSGGMTRPAPATTSRTPAPSPPRSNAAPTPAPARASTTAPTPAPAPRDAATRSFAQRDSARRALAADAARAQQSRRDSLARLRAAQRREPPRSKPRVTRPLEPSVVASARSQDTVRTVQLVVDVDSSAAATTPAAARVQRIEPFAAPAARDAESDSCACRLRGTVEVDWARPLEQDLPVEILLTGPATQREVVELFIGSPREFRMGPLPCGTYQLELRPGGRLRYALARGDGRIECRGSAQVRVVLTPVRR